MGEVEDFLVKEVASKINFIRELKDSLELAKHKLNRECCKKYDKADLINTIEQIDSRLESFLEDCEEQVKA